MLYGALEIKWEDFAGASFDANPTEMPPAIASDALNIDFDGRAIAKRKGRSAYNSSAPVASKVWGVWAYYPNSGSRSIVFQAGTKVYADTNQDGDFGDANEEIATITGGAPMDFFQFKGNLYFGNGVDALKKWTGGASAAASVANLTAPAAAPGVSLSQTVIESFDATGTVVGAGITQTSDSTKKLQGTNSLKLEFTASSAEGSYVYKAFSAGATVDLSGAEYLELWVYGNISGPTFQVGIYKDGDTIGTTAPMTEVFPTWQVTKRKRWLQIRVPLAGLSPTDRNACPGWWIKFLDEGGRGYSSNTVIRFDNARAVGGLTPDHYTYYATYAEVDSNNNILRESAPSAAAEIDYQDQAATGITASLTETAQTATLGGTMKILLYRYRKDGFFPKARLVKINANSTASVTDTLSDGALATNAALGSAPEIILKRDDPPLAKTYALVNNRLLAGNVTISATNYPYRVYVSRFAFPENFGGDERPNDPAAAGWFDLPDKDAIVRIIEYHGMALIFASRSVWTLEGSGFDSFVLAKRADVGLDARWAVATSGRLVYFLTSDGIRVMAPSEGVDGEFATWVISEPVDSKLQAIPAAARDLCALGVDERARVVCSIVRSGQTTPDAALVFDPKIGSLADGMDLTRPGWTYYESFPCGVFCTLKRGGGDAGQLLAGDTTTGKVWRLFRDGSNALIETDDGSAVAWAWMGNAVLAPGGHKLTAVHVTGLFDAAQNQSVTAVVRNETDAAVGSKSLSLGSSSSGIVEASARYPVSADGRLLKLRLSGSHSVALKTRHALLGVYQR